MSGKKTGFVTLTPEQNEALHDNLMRRLFLFDINPTGKPGDQQATNTLQDNPIFISRIAETQEHLAAREDAFMHSLDRVNQQMLDIEQKTSQRLIDSQKRMDNQLFNQNNKVESQFVTLLDERLDSFNEQVLVNHHQQQTQIMRLRRQVVTQQKSVAEKAATAENWLRNAHQLISFIDQNYDHTKFAPNKLNTLDEDLQIAFQNYDQGLFEAALVTGQNVYRLASELRIVLEREESQWNTCYLVAINNIEKLLKDMDEKSITDFETEPGGEKIKFDINFWSNGHWAQLIKKLQNIHQQLENSPQSLSIQDLRKWISEEIPDIEANSDAIKKEAVDNLVNSQIRTNIADLIMQALHNQGYQLNVAQFLGDDSRNGFEFTANSISGNAIRVFVNPGPSEKNEIQLEAMDQKPQTEYFLKRRALEISQALQKFGLNVEQFIQKKASGNEFPKMGSLAVAEQKSQYAVH